MRKWNWSGWGALALILVSVLPSAGEEGAAPATDVSLDAVFASRYVWRGMPLNEDPVLQPAATIAGGGFTLNLWGNVDTSDWGKEKGGYGDENWNFTEVDYTASYERKVGPVTLTGGIITYTFPNTATNSTTELFLKAAGEIWGSPALAYFLDEDAAPGVGYLSLDLSPAFEVWKSDPWALGLELALHGGWANKKFVRTYYGRNADAVHDWSVGAALPLTLPYGFTLKPGYQHSGLADSKLRDRVHSVEGWDREPDNDVFTCALNWTGFF